jgi:hypothetical protein
MDVSMLHRRDLACGDSTAIGNTRLLIIFHSKLTIGSAYESQVDDTSGFLVVGVALFAFVLHFIPKELLRVSRDKICILI